MYISAVLANYPLKVYFLPLSPSFVNCLSLSITHTLILFNFFFSLSLTHTHTHTHISLSLSMSLSLHLNVPPFKMFSPSFSVCLFFCRFLSFSLMSPQSLTLSLFITYRSQVPNVYFLLSFLSFSFSLSQRQCVIMIKYYLYF